ncbi:MAG: precorrin-6y C5,15-methyltransferase (decarboxylating) subunit CbiE [Nitrospinota bacterium]
MQKRVNVIGVGASGIDSLSPEMLRVISSSDVLMGWERTLSLFEEVQIKKIPVVGGLSSIVSFIESSPEKSITILASGDPNFFGISEYLFKRVDKELLKIFPNVSSMQLAFAAVKESMNNAKIVSVHGRNLNTLDQALKGFEKVGVFTDQKNSPSKIAAHLLKKDGLELEAYLCENLGSENEAVRKLSLKALSSQTCSDLSIVVLIRKNRREEKKFPFGIPDEMFFTRNKMITKEEVRVITLAKLRLFSTAVFWDIGSGSGSVSIEAGFIARQGRVLLLKKTEAV